MSFCADITLFIDANTRAEVVPIQDREPRTVVRLRDKRDFFSDVTIHFTTLELAQAFADLISSQNDEAAEKIAAVERAGEIIKSAMRVIPHAAE